MADTTSKILRDYYLEKDFLFSPDGILKFLSVMACIAAGVAALATREWCARAPALAGGWGGGGAGGVALAAAAALALLAAAALLAAPQHAPVLWLYSDLVVSTVIGVLLVVCVILGVIYCQLGSVLLYVYFVLGVVTAGTTTGSAVLGYAAAMRRVDAARPQLEPRRAPPTELDV